jgi:hypothetical protein
MYEDGQKVRGVRSDSLSCPVLSSVISLKTWEQQWANPHFDKNGNKDKLGCCNSAL